MNLPNFDNPALLALLPLALLPFLRWQQEATVQASTSWLPADTTGIWLSRLWLLSAALAIASLVIALAGPHSRGSSVQRITRGAEISIVLDRSSSMDLPTRHNLPKEGGGAESPPTKNEVVRDALASLIQQRPDHRYALTMFNVAPMRVAPFTDDAELVLAGLDASGIGRGPSDTDIGRALLAAIDAFDGREYSGSRVILLVSDGGARLDKPTRTAVSDGLATHRAALYFIYVRSGINSPDLGTIVGTNIDQEIDDAQEEVALHRFFAGLDIDYHVFQAHDPTSMSQAITEIDRAQNLPLTVNERVPRSDYTAGFLVVALLASTALLGLGLLRHHDWELS